MLQIDFRIRIQLCSLWRRTNALIPFKFLIRIHDRLKHDLVSNKLFKVKLLSKAIVFPNYVLVAHGVSNTGVNITLLILTMVNLLRSITIHHSASKWASFL